jgi:hypothetical protein
MCDTERDPTCARLAEELFENATKYQIAETALVLALKLDACSRGTEVLAVFFLLLGGRTDSRHRCCRRRGAPVMTQSQRTWRIRRAFKPNRFSFA